MSRAPRALLVAIVVPTLLAACGSTASLHEAAIAKARAQVQVAVDQITEDLPSLTTDSLTAALELSEIKVHSVVGLTADERAEVTLGGGGSLTTAIEAAEAELTLVTYASSEGGDGFGNGQGAAYTCWSVDVDLTRGVVGTPVGLRCPQWVSDYFLLDQFQL